jgi:transcriptional regulator with XRE-family HTH domain
MTATTTPINHQLGRVLARLREQRCLSIEDIAEATNVSPACIDDIESDVRSPTWARLCAIAEVLDTPISTIAQEAENGEEDRGCHVEHIA